MNDGEGEGIATIKEFRADWYIMWENDYQANGDHTAKAYLALGEKTTYHQWNSETVEGFVLSSKTLIIRECFVCETFFE